MSDFEIPPEPEAPSDGGEGQTHYRYEDVAQDGRLRLEGVWPPMGRILWTQIPLSKALMRLGLGQGVRSVLTRVVLNGADVPISPREAATTRVRCRLATERDAEGCVARILLESWLETRAPRRRSSNPMSFGTDESVSVARAFGQHVFTRPTARPPDHRVLRLDDPELPEVPEASGRWLAPEELLTLPTGAAPLDPEPMPDPAVIAFGLAHTDGNQHVNFLTYPRLVEDAALRRLADHDAPRILLARRAELGYRKPCFAGERARIVAQAFSLDGRFGIVAAFFDHRADLPARGPWSAFGRPRCVARMLLSP